MLPPSADSKTSQPPMFPEIAQYISKVQAENETGQVFLGIWSCVYFIFHASFLRLFMPWEETGSELVVKVCAGADGLLRVAGQLSIFDCLHPSFHCFVGHVAKKRRTSPDAFASSTDSSSSSSQASSNFGRQLGVEWTWHHAPSVPDVRQIEPVGRWQEGTVAPMSAGHVSSPGQQRLVGKRLQHKIGLSGHARSSALPICLGSTQTHDLLHHRGQNSFYASFYPLFVLKSCRWAGECLTFFNNLTKQEHFAWWWLSCAVRKGVPAHAEVITAYLRGMPFQEKDQVVLVDLLPNRLWVPKVYLQKPHCSKQSCQPFKFSMCCSKSSHWMLNLP